jgi:hypothetical protein
MKHISIVALLLLGLTLSTAEAQPSWKIELYGDAEMSNCAIEFSAPGVVRIHIFHTGDSPSGAIEFALYAPECLAGAVWLGDVISEDWLQLGNTQNAAGIAVSYRGCASTPIHIGYVNFYVPTLDLPCCEMFVSDPVDPGVGINAVTCLPENRIYPVAVRSLIIKPTPGCPCGQALPVKSTTWGGVKALYR